jgi:uncharacterized lipoprotein
MMNVARYCSALTWPAVTRSLLPLLLLPLVLTGACSSDAKKREYYGAVETPSLEIPEGLARPTSSSALVIGVPPIPLTPLAMESRPPRISSTTSGLDPNARFSWSPEGLYLLVDDTLESVQRRLGVVFERAGMQKIRLDDNGVYRFEYYQVFEEEDGFFRKLAFWSRDKREDYSGAYQVSARADGEKTRVFLKYADGTDCEPDAAEHILDVVRSRLG